MEMVGEVRHCWSGDEEGAPSQGMWAPLEAGRVRTQMLPWGRKETVLPMPWFEPSETGVRPLTRRSVR